VGGRPRDEEGPQRLEAPGVLVLDDRTNGIVEPLHAKAMRVLIRKKDEAEQWLEARPEEAMQLQKPAPDDATVLLPTEE